MTFTFGIITNGENNEYLDLIIKSIQKENIPEYEIIIVGHYENNLNNQIKIINFDENIKKGWITKKKNLITENAKYDNIVYMHDYIILEEGWYNGWLKYGENFKACMNMVKNLNGERYRDWTLFPFAIIPDQRPIGSEGLLPYDLEINDNINKHIYFSGSYWVAKKNIMQEIPLDENKCWGQGEDVWWSAQYTSKYLFSMNSYSCVKLLKQKEVHWNFCSEKSINFVKNLNINTEERFKFLKKICK